MEPVAPELDASSSRTSCGALDAPGEWFLARDGTLYYKPLPGEDMAKAEVVAPVADKFIVIQGDPAAGKFVEHVTFKGLTFHHAQWLTPPGGFEPAQAAAPIEAVVMADGARHVTFEDCEIGHIGTYAVWFRKGCRDCVVRRCHLHDFGAGGVRIGETGIAEDGGGARPATSSVDNNIIRHGGHIFPCAVGVWIGHSGDNQVTHNEIADLFYTRHLRRLALGLRREPRQAEHASRSTTSTTSAGACSATWAASTRSGRPRARSSRDNVFHDIYAYSYGGWGLYTDEGSTGILFENNLVYNTKNGSFHQHYGKENIIRNNILVDSREHQVVSHPRRTAPVLHASSATSSYWKTGPALSGAWGNAKTVSGSNCWFNSAGAPIEFMGKSLAEWQKAGHETGSIVADPLFVDVAAGDFRLKPDSPALALGFKPFDGSKAGVYGDAAWIAKARDVTYPPLELPPEIPPVAAHLTFERDEPGRPPRGFDVSVANKGDSILVTEETAAAGKRSVKITDAPGLQHTWMPLLVCQTRHAKGVVSNAFDLRVEKASRVDYEWRDYSQGGYQTGPHLAIREARLRLVGGTTMELPENQWVRFEIESGVGPDSTGTWSLTVTRSRPVAAGLQGPRLCEPWVQDADLGRLHQQRGRGDVVLPGQLHAQSAADGHRAGPGREAVT